jgi:hypothetical protein
MFFGVSAFGSDWLTMDGMSQIVIVLPGLLLNHTPDAPFTNFLKGPYIIALCERHEVGKTITPLHFPWQGQVLLQQDETDDCPAEATQVCIL